MPYSWNFWRQVRSVFRKSLTEQKFISICEQDLGSGAEIWLEICRHRQVKCKAHRPRASAAGQWLVDWVVGLERRTVQSSRLCCCSVSDPVPPASQSHRWSSAASDFGRRLHPATESWRPSRVEKPDCGCAARHETVVPTPSVAEYIHSITTPGSLRQKT